MPFHYNKDFGESERSGQQWAERYYFGTLLSKTGQGCDVGD